MQDYDAIIIGTGQAGPALARREDVGRAYEKGETKGFMKILVDRNSKLIVGASLLGTRRR